MNVAFFKQENLRCLIGLQRSISKNKELIIKVKILTLPCIYLYNLIIDLQREQKNSESMGTYIYNSGQYYKTYQP